MTHMTPLMTHFMTHFTVAISRRREGVRHKRPTAAVYDAHLPLPKPFMTHFYDAFMTRMTHVA